MLLNVTPVAFTLIALEEKVIVEVPALNVRLVLVEKFNDDPEFAIVIVLDPSVIVLTLLLLDDKAPAVTL